MVLCNAQVHGAMVPLAVLNNTSIIGFTVIVQTALQKYNASSNAELKFSALPAVLAVPAVHS